MGWIVLTIIMLIGALAAILIGGYIQRVSRTHQAESLDAPDYERKKATDEAGAENLVAKAVGYGLGGGLIGFWMLLTFISAFHQVPAGHVGVVYEFGAIVGQTGDGPQWVAPWRTVDNATVQVQSFAFTDNPDDVVDDVEVLGGGLDSFSIETQDVFIAARLDIKVSPRDVQGLYREVGDDYVNQLIPQRVAQAFKDVTVQFKAVDIAPNRDEIKDQVEQRLDADLDDFSIDVVALLIENISFSPEFTASIEAKQVATQEAARAAELIVKAENDALAVIATSEGVAGALVVEANGKAEANVLITNSITPLLVQWEAVQKLADDITIALIPSGEGVIIDPTTLLGQAPAPAPAP